MARDEHLTEWVGAISLNLMALESRDVEVDFTKASLRAVEVELLKSFSPPTMSTIPVSGPFSTERPATLARRC
ncbi:hypothetical protein [Plantactinospora sp. GCM10030261]|uniref:hypothetical protein n=1 Tax=Plantactinospora sp. GCM10030261 TaxID=3273420 RepID=UPI003617F6C5